MTNQEILNYGLQAVSYLFGTGGIIAIVRGRKQRKIALDNQQTSALQSMQKAYDDFVKDAKDIIDGLKAELLEVRTELKEVKRDFREYRKEHKNCA